MRLVGFATLILLSAVAFLPGVVLAVGCNDGVCSGATTYTISGGQRIFVNITGYGMYGENLPVEFYWFASLGSSVSLKIGSSVSTVPAGRGSVGGYPFYINSITPVSETQQSLNSVSIDIGENENSCPEDCGGAVPLCAGDMQVTSAKTQYTSGDFVDVVVTLKDTAGNPMTNTQFGMKNYDYSGVISNVSVADRTNTTGGYRKFVRYEIDTNSTVTYAYEFYTYQDVPTAGCAKISKTITFTVTPRACTENDWQSTITPTTCPSTGIQNKTWSKNSVCTGGITHPSSEIITCSYQAPQCVYTYSNWGVCSASGIQTRTVISSAPSNCQGSPVTSQTCSYSEICTESNWNYTLNPSECPPNQHQTKTWVKTGSCQNGTTHPATETITCNYTNVTEQEAETPPVIAPPLTSASCTKGCVCNSTSVTCPELEHEIRAVISDISNRVIQISISKPSENSVVITAGNVQISTTENLTIRDSKIYIETPFGRNQVTVLPDSAVAKATEITQVVSVELRNEFTGETTKPVYTIKGTKKANILFIIPVTLDITTKVNGDNGSVMSVDKPWWSFLAW